jgi:hypothetical protein
MPRETWVFYTVKWNYTSVENPCNLSTCLFSKILLGLPVIMKYENFLSLIIVVFCKSC